MLVLEQSLLIQPNTVL